MNKPATTNTYFDRYIQLVPQDSIAEALRAQDSSIVEFFEGIDEEKSKFAYAPEKWTLKEMLLHIIDTERIFSYRALAFARNEPQILTGFDENEYAAASQANDRTWKSLCDEFLNLRKSTKDLLLSFDDATGSKTGTAGTNTISVAAFSYTILGHFYHHKNVAKERYS